MLRDGQIYFYTKRSLDAIEHNMLLHKIGFSEHSMCRINNFVWNIDAILSYVPHFYGRTMRQYRWYRSRSGVARAGLPTRQLRIVITRQMTYN